jgi:hypothetical protein
MLRLEHIAGNELPADWQRRAHARPGEHYTVILLPETQNRAKPRQKRSQQPLAGLWKDRADMSDVAAYVRELRKPRY